jgi:hypothetical protein
MSLIRVYNPTTTPCVYGDAQSIGGFEFAVEERELVQDLLDAGELIEKVWVEPAAQVIDAVDTSDELDETEDLSSEETEVSFDESVEELSEDQTEDTFEGSAFDEQTNESTTDTIRKSRRRRPLTVKE